MSTDKSAEVGDAAAAWRYGAPEQAQLFEVIKRRSFRQGAPFTLSSGAVSTIYFDMKPSMFSPEGAHLIACGVGAIAQRIEARHLGGLEMGAVPIAASLAPVAHQAGWPLSLFFIRKQAKEHGAQKRIEGLSDPATLRGAKTAVIEDVTTTGGSAMKAIEVLRAEGASVGDVITLVDREAGAEAAFAKEGITLHALFRMSDFVGAAGAEMPS